jgi:hypothetical protein
MRSSSESVRAEPMLTREEETASERPGGVERGAEVSRERRQGKRRSESPGPSVELVEVGLSCRGRSHDLGVLETGEDGCERPKQASLLSIRNVDPEPYTFHPHLVPLLSPIVFRANERVRSAHTALPTRSSENLDDLSSRYSPRRIFSSLASSTANCLRRSRALSRRWLTIR